MDYHEALARIRQILPDLALQAKGVSRSSDLVLLDREGYPTRSRRRSRRSQELAARLEGRNVPAEEHGAAD